MQQNRTKINSNFIIFLDKKFSVNNKFDSSNLSFVNGKIVNFDINYKYSVDKSNIINNEPVLDEYYIVIECNTNDGENVNNLNGKLNINININNSLNIFEFDCVKYFDEEIDIDVIIFENIINNYPKWNFYDNQQVTINNWINTCIATSMMYGHKMVYFKTEAVETSHTFQNNYIKNVVDIKKLMVSVPSNLIPNDVNIYTDWDFPAQDEYSFDIVDSIFKHAFGIDKIPQKDDVIFFPLINRLLVVTSVQPKNGFMGVIGWWKIFFANYAQDESINFDEEMKQAISGSEFMEVVNEFEGIQFENVIDGNKILENTVEEKGEANEEYDNRLVDSESYIDLKETENIRAQQHKQLNIVSINPSTNSFPITMYDCTNVDARNIALVYNLGGNLLIGSKRNKLNINEKCSFSLNISVGNKFRGEIFDLVNKDEVILFSLSAKRYSEGIKLFANFSGDNLIELSTLKIHEFYKLGFDFNNTTKKLKISIFILNNGITTIQTIKEIDITKVFDNLSLIYIYGGKYYYNDLSLSIDNKKIYHDHCNPKLNI